MIKQYFYRRFFIFLVTFGLFWINIHITLAQTQLTCNSDISGTISTIGEVDRYTLAGEIGVPIIIRAYGSVVDASIELYSPENNLIQRINPTGNLSRIEYTPNVNGEYTLLVLDEGANTTGSYSLSVQFLQRSCLEETLGCNVDLSSNLELRTEMNAYGLALEAGVPVIIQGYGSVTDVSFEIYDLDNNLIQRVNPRSNLSRWEYTPEVSGTYILLVLDNGGNTSGSYSLSVQFLQRSCLEEMLGCNVDLSSNLEIRTEMDAYGLALEAGVPVIIQGYGSVTDVSFEIYELNNNLIQRVNPNSNLSRWEYTPEVSGTYILLVLDNGGNTSGSYSLSVQFLQRSCLEEMLGCNVDLSSNLEIRTEMDAYGLALEAGVPVIIQGYGGVTDVSFEIYDLDNNLIRRVNPNSNLSRWEYTPEVSGTYILLVLDNGGNTSGSYSLSVQFLQRSCLEEMLGCNVDLSSNLEIRTEMDAYGLALEAGVPVIIQGYGSVTDVSFEIYELNNNLIQRVNPNSNLSRWEYTPEVSGTYILLVLDNGGNTSGSYSLSVQFLQRSCLEEMLGCNVDLSSNLEIRTEMDAYGLALEAGVPVIIQGYGGVTDVSFEIYDLDNNLIRRVNPNSNLSRWEYTPEVSGTYILLVLDNGGNTSGPYSLSVQFLQRSCLEATLDCNSSLDYNLELVTAMDAYGLQLEAGVPIIIRSYASIADIQFELYDLNDSLIHRVRPTGNLNRLEYTPSESGTYILLVLDEDGNTSGNYDLSVIQLSSSCEAILSIDCSADISQTTVESTQMDGLSFEASSGDKVLLRLGSTSFSFDGLMQIYREDGYLIDEASGNDLQELFFDVQLDGTYYVIIMDEDGNGTGTYGFSMQKMNSGCTDEFLLCGSTYNLRLAKVAEIDAFQIPDANFIIRITSSQSTLKAQMHGENGPIGGPFRIEEGLIELGENIGGGSNRFLTILDEEVHSNITYQLHYQVVGQGNCGNLIQCGATRVRNLSGKGEMQSWRFQGSEGDPIVFRMSEGRNTSVNSEMRLYGPAGNRIDIPATGSPARLDTELFSDGIYTLLTMDEGGNDIGEYAFSFQITNDHGCGEDISYNKTNEGDLNYRSEMKAYLFDAELGDKWILQHKGVNVAHDARVEVYDPNGTLVAQDITENGMARLDTIVARENGPHKILVMDNKGENVGTFGISLQKVNQEEALSNLGEASRLDGNLNVVAQMDAYSFEGNKDDLMNIKINMIDFGLDLIMEVYNPQGGLVEMVEIEDSLSYSKILPSAGKYTLIIRDDDGCDLGDYALETQKFPVGTSSQLYQNVTFDIYPNPAYTWANIGYNLPHAATIKLDIVDLHGRVISQLINQQQSASFHKLKWDASKLVEGIYFLRMQIDDYVVTKKVIKK